MKKSTVYSQPFQRKGKLCLQSTFAQQRQALLTAKKLTNSVLAVVGRPWTVDQKGFTIVEILVVASILGIIGFMMSDIVTRSLQGSQRTVVIGSAKQNGQVALDSISQVIRNSDLVVCIDGAPPNPIGTTAGDVLALYTQDGRYVRFRHTLVSGNDTIVVDFPNIDVLINNNLSVPKSLQVNICDIGVYPVHNPQILTDTNNTNGVLIQKVGGTGSIFTVTKRPGSKDAVLVQFEVRPSNTTGGFENQLGGTGAIQFQETIQLR